MRRDPNCFGGTFPDYRRRLGSVTLTGQGLGLGLGTSLFPVGAMEIKAGISAHNGIHGKSTRAMIQLEPSGSIALGL